MTAKHFGDFFVSNVSRRMGCKKCYRWLAGWLAVPKPVIEVTNPGHELAFMRRKLAYFV